MDKHKRNALILAGVVVFFSAVNAYFKYGGRPDLYWRPSAILELGPEVLFPGFAAYFGYSIISRFINK